MQFVDYQPDHWFRHFEKCGMAMTVDDSGDDRIKMEGLGKPYTVVNAGDSSDTEGTSETGSDGCEGEGGARHSGRGKNRGAGAGGLRAWRTPLDSSKEDLPSLALVCVSM